MMIFLNFNFKAAFTFKTIIDKRQASINLKQIFCRLPISRLQAKAAMKLNWIKTVISLSISQFTL